jgi:tRNA C32,U32 (ribose-2'-O)-methylase TrmJ
VNESFTFFLSKVSESAALPANKMLNKPVLLKSTASQATEKSAFVFGRERRALALRKIQQIQRALAPGFPFTGPPISAASSAVP